MCGIFGVFRASGSPTAPQVARNIFRQLAVRSMTRGRDSAGVGRIGAETVDIVKEGCPIDQLLGDPAVVRMLDVDHGQAADAAVALFGHSRMETHGSFLNPANNQPVVRNDLVCIHNGIIVNAPDLWRDILNERPTTEVDTEVILALVEREIAQGAQGLLQAVQKILGYLEGSYSISLVDGRRGEWILATNTGSLYWTRSRDGSCSFFASERSILDPPSTLLGQPVEQLHPGQVVTLMEASTFARRVRVLPTEGLRPQRRVGAQNASSMRAIEARVNEGYARAKRAADTLRRCTRCILPETMPFIEFDAQGVCNYCHRHRPRETRGVEALREAVAPYRGRGRFGDCLVSLSGGRDSSYALHYVVRQLGLRAVAYSYDWGMLTDLGRRNQARMTGKLGVEHVLVSANIQQKRRNIRKNVEAWLHRPRLGTVPLFMAGDKQYFYHLNRVQRALQLPLSIYADNSLEHTDFKYGFAGILIDSKVGKAHAIGLGRTLRLFLYYGREYVLNPSYINGSVLDTLGAYGSQYFTSKEYLYIFRYLLWDEREVESTLTREYGWELAPDTQSSWRIGDGTQAFYNYLYFVGAALTEHDTFRSNQIREGAIDRASALKLAQVGNVPRIESLLWYFDTVGLKGDDVLAVVNARLPRSYDGK